MEPKSRISDSVFFGGLAALVLALVGLWYGWGSFRNRPRQTVAEVRTLSPGDATTNAGSDVVSAAAEAVATFPDGFPPVIPVSLVPHLIDAENGSWLRDEQYKLIPRGTQDFGGIEFHLEGLIQLQGRASKDWKKRSYREQIRIPLSVTNRTDAGVEIVQRGSNVSSVYLVGGTRYETETDAVAANLVWHYTDGTSATTPIRYNVHVRDWIRYPFEQPERLPYPFAKVVWTTPVAKQEERALRLYRIGLANPAPKKIIQQLEFVGMTGEATLFAVGLTLDPLPLGRRPDNTGDLEPTDSGPGYTLLLQVVTPDGAGVSGARVTIRAHQKTDSPGWNITHSSKTDDSGTVTLRYSLEKLETYEIAVAHDDYGGRKMVWDCTMGDVIPATYTLALGAAMSLGGQVVDVADAPIAGANVNVYRFWSGGEEVHKKGEQPDYSGGTGQKAMVTDVQGRWQAKGIPLELKDRIGVSFRHREYLDESVHLEGSSAAMEKMRAGTHKMILKQGLVVRGRVIGELGQPIEGAKVELGERYSNNRRSATTDATGEFVLSNVSAGEQPLAVTAPGYAPDTRNVMISMPPPELVIKLGGAHTIGALVQDEQAAPIAGVSVELGWSSRPLQYSTKTDANGRFTWNDAPAEPVKFLFSKEGFMGGKEKLLNPDTENVVVLKKKKKVSGTVVDDATGQPLTKFRVGLGNSYNDGRNFYFTRGPGGEERSDPNGQFELEWTSEDSNAVHAGADEYSDATVTLPETPGAEVQVTLRLKASPALRGVVTASDGTPLPGMTVGVTPGFSSSLSVRDRRIVSNSGAQVPVTDAQGRFALNSPPEQGMVVASGDVGFGSADIAQVRASGVLVVQAFGRIEGMVRVAGQPLAGEIVRYNTDIQNMWYDTSQGLGAKTDEQGSFTLEKIPAGPGHLIRLIQTSANSWVHSHRTPVKVEPGKTTQVTLGESGVVIRGTVRFETPPAEGAASLRINGYAGDYHFSVKADGTFTVDSVPPGLKQVRVEATRRRPGGQEYDRDTVASGETSVTVPDGAGSYQSLNAGEIILKPVSKP